MSVSKIEKTMIGVEGHITIVDPDTGEVLARKRNAVNFENMSIAIANLLANEVGSTGSHHIATMRFGNGGTTIDGTGNVTYKATNTSITTGTLYNQTYSQSVDETVSGSATNGTEVSHTNGELYSDAVVTCTLDYNVPVGQDTLDDSTNMNGDYVFDELGLFTANDNMLTHVVFHPVQKSANRKIQVIYTVRIRTSYSEV
jgi:hypothetical protein